MSVINSADDALTALIHLGYLGYDADIGEAFIPNYEVATAFHSALETGSWSKIADELHKEIILVGVNYDRETKKHECVIEKTKLMNEKS